MPMPMNMSILSNLSISKQIDYNIDCSILPVLLTQLNDETLFKYVSKLLLNYGKIVKLRMTDFLNKTQENKF